MSMSKDEIINKAYKTGFEAENKYGGCAQCTLLAVFSTLNIDKPELVKAATGFAGGGGRMCDGSCGGYIAGIMAMSSIFGRRASNMDGDEIDKQTAFNMAVKLRETFIQEYGSVTCKDIHKKLFNRNYNMWNMVEFEQFLADGAHVEKCNGVVGTASAATVSAILEEAEKRGIAIEEISNL